MESSSAGKLIAPQTHRPENSSTRKLIDRQTQQPTNSSTRKLIARKLIDQKTHQLENSSPSKLIDQKTQQPANSSTGKLIDRHTHRISCQGTAIVCTKYVNKSCLSCLLQGHLFKIRICHREPDICLLSHLFAEQAEALSLM
jgi:phosphoribosyl-ATP pyrophosphohydrolase